MVVLDGSHGEGGGQILRTALSLSLCTGRPFRIEHIRAKRRTPGLMRQHLTAVLAAAKICDAQVRGAEIDSQTLEFSPGAIRAGEYRFATGTAGSCTLVFQTILPALLQAKAPSRVTMQGGTHNPWAPPYHFLERAFLCQLSRMGARVSLELKRFGFYPHGGGEFIAQVEPVGRLSPLHLGERGGTTRCFAECFIAGLPPHIAERELETVRKSLGWSDEMLLLRVLPNDQGPGNALIITLEYERVIEVFTGFGQKGVTAETVARDVIAQASRFMSSRAAVGPFLADQMLLPMALAEAGSFTTSALTQHSLTNAEVIRKFLSVHIRTQPVDSQCHEIRIFS
jgi:RNA 3'-terminal phosphate cyclase (ATP)